VADFLRRRVGGWPLRHAGLVLAIAVPAWMFPVTAAPRPADAASVRPPTASPAGWAAGYRDPPFGNRCAWHVFGEGERPPWQLFLEDPLCVEYAKRNITLDNGGWLAFLLAEPSRFAIAIPSCRYWQRDHWSVQLSTAAPSRVCWDGSYWFDKGRGVAAARLANFRIAGVSAGAGDVMTALRPDFPELAAAVSVFGGTAGESGIETSVPRVVGC
jgi:hypothetical protein